MRTTVPMSITHQFGLKGGDGLKWRIEADGNELAIMTNCGKIVN